MKNWRTTVAGGLILLGSVAYAGAAILQGETPNIEAIIGGLTGLGLLGSADGGI